MARPNRAASVAANLIFYVIPMAALLLTPLLGLMLSPLLLVGMYRSWQLYKRRRVPLLDPAQSILPAASQQSVIKGVVDVEGVLASDSLDELEGKYQRAQVLFIYSRLVVVFVSSLVLIVAIPEIVGQMVNICHGDIVNTYDSVISMASIVLLSLVILAIMLCIDGIRRGWYVSFLFSMALVGLFSAVGLLLIVSEVGVIGDVVERMPAASEVDVYAFDALNFALVIGSIAWFGTFYVSLVRGVLALAEMKTNARDLLSETVNGARFPGNVLSALWGLPPLTRFVRKPSGRYLAIVVASVVSGLLLATASFLALGAPVFLSVAVYSLLSASKSLTLLMAPVALLAGGLLMFAVFAALVFIGRLLERATFATTRLSLQEAIKRDTRPPVLFLRAFRDDQVGLERRRLPFSLRVLRLGERAPNLDHILLEEATVYGPLVGLGSPRDKFPPYGAARGYFDGMTWQDAVASLVRDSSATILCVDATKGVWWEVEHLAATNGKAKTLFLVHPSCRQRDSNDALLSTLIDKLQLPSDQRDRLMARPHSGLIAPLLGGRLPVIGFFLRHDNGLEVIRSATFSNDAYRLALHVFLRSRLGFPRVAAS